MKKPEYTAGEMFNFAAGNAFGNGGVDFFIQQMQLIIVVISSNPFIRVLETPAAMWLFG